MRTALTAAFLAMSLLGVAACSGEEARLRAEIEEKLAVYNELFERRAALRAELYPDRTPMRNQVRERVETNLALDQKPEWRAAELELLDGDIAALRIRFAQLEAVGRRKAAGEPGPNDAALKRVLTPQ